MLFWWLGAWPVAGFNGVDVVLAVVLLRAQRAAARHKEEVLLSEAGLNIRVTDKAGRVTESRLPNHWLSVVLTERPGRVPALLVGARGRQIEIATKLGEAEKRDLAAQLEAAVHRLRNPVFDNPQLREPAG
jgi:uncharacterized membrane protein